MKIYNPSQYHFLYKAGGVENLVASHFFTPMERRMGYLMLIKDQKAKIYIPKKSKGIQVQQGFEFLVSGKFDFYRRMLGRYCEELNDEINTLNQVPLGNLSNVEKIQYLKKLLNVYDELMSAYRFINIHIEDRLVEIIEKEELGHLMKAFDFIGDIKLQIRIILDRALYTNSQRYLFHNYRQHFAMSFADLDMVHCSIGDILYHLEHETSPSSSIVSEAISYLPGYYDAPLQGKKAFSLYDRFDLHFFPYLVSESIRGTPASTGIYRGRVKIVQYDLAVENTDEGWAKVNDSVVEGDVLICPQTLPNMVPACIKAGAIVTDEGGITCHAAVITRELKKPCVVGTYYASEVFHDGDIVEVNGYTGEVKKAR
jgi:phosphohistidine swiveling domain-containing protein